ncbi:MAG: alpha-xylosidase, partial [bacterium]|nr:alpha-xylosidase [bacterium]
MDTKTHNDLYHVSSPPSQRSIYQTDARIFHQPSFHYDYVSSVTDYRISRRQCELLLSLSSGASAILRLIPFAPGILRFQFCEGTPAFDETSPMLAPTGLRKTSFRSFTNASEISLVFNSYRITIAKNPFHLSIHRKDTTPVMSLDSEKLAGAPICGHLGFRRSQSAQPFLSWRIRNDERFFGLGEKFCKVERTSTRATIWSSDTCGSNTTDLSYKSVPVLFSSRGWGIMLHTSYRSLWEIGTFSYTTGSCLTEDTKLDAFIFLAPSFKQLIALYPALTGRPAMPPRWALGIWMSRCQYTSRQQVDNVLARLRKERIPCDVIHLDPLWMNTHYYYKIGVDACDFVPNEDAFPNQPRMFRDFLRQGFHTSLWINPYLPENTPIYEEARSRGFLLQDANGAFARLEFGEPVGIVDFTNPAAKQWWKDHLIRLLRNGAATLKPDYGDRVPETALFFNGRTGREMHNLYLHLYVQTVFEAVQEVYGQAVIWRRAGYIGSQRYPATWAGDTQVSWEAMRSCLRGGLSAGLTGEAFWTSDIGGFSGPPPSPELYIRWAQWGLLSGVSRFHGTSPREPWEFGPQALAIVRHYAQLRYRLIPYLLAAAYESTSSGLPMMRHLVLEFPHEPNVETIDDQYLLGSDLLVAPVLIEGARSRYVYVPSGTWHCLESPLRAFTGPRFFPLLAPLPRIPILVRPAAVIPRYPAPPQHLNNTPSPSLLLEIFTGDGERLLSIPDGPYFCKIHYRCAK